MALTLLQIVKGEKTFKGKTIAEISYTHFEFWKSFQVKMFLRVLTFGIVRIGHIC